MIAYSELLRAGTNLSTAFANLIPTMIVLAVLYIGINTGLTRLAGAVEERLRRDTRGITPQLVTAGFVPETAAEPDVPETLMHHGGRPRG
jgi:glutamate transport system permease protein